MIIKRIAELQLQRNLSQIGAVLVSGPKYSGKTFLSSIYAKSSIQIDANIISSFQNFGKQLITQGKNPRLIDEWQWLPQIWDIVRFDIDSRPIDQQAE